MASAIISFISPKGYGMAKLEDGRRAFLPVRIVCGHKPYDKIEIELEPGESENRIRAKSINRPKPNPKPKPKKSVKSPSS